MASIPEEPPSNSLTDEETIALRKKRSRRVSFADCEITSVHIFNRDDEDFETPPDSYSSIKQKNKQQQLQEAEDEVLGFFRDLADTDDSKEMSPTNDVHDDEDDHVDANKSFLRPIGSPSPGSSSTIAGSATSNDEDNFFGPVSASFIRHGTFSDSAASDDNHDITMDSTAFSMHFRSLARSDSGGSTFIEEKTPSHVTTPDSGSFMALTKAKKLVPQFSVPIEKSGGRDSNDMSLVGENPHNYDYGKLSPRLEALLAAGSRNLEDVSVSDFSNSKSLKQSEVLMYKDNPHGHVGQKDYGDQETDNIGKLEISSMEMSATRMELDEVNGISSTNPVDHIPCGFSSDRNEDFSGDISVNQEMETPNKLNKIYGDCTKAMTGLNFPAVCDVVSQSLKEKVIQFNPFAQYESRKISDEGCLEETSPRDKSGNCGIYQNSDQQLISPLVGSTSLFSAKQQQVFLDAAKSSRQLSYVTPSPKQPGYFLGKENIRSCEKKLSGHKSSSRFKIFEPSPLANKLKDGIERSKLRLLKLHSSTSSPFNVTAEEHCNDFSGKDVDSTVVNLDKHLFSVDQKKRHHEGTGHMGSTGNVNLKNQSSSSKNEGAVTLVEGGQSLLSMPTHILSMEGADQIMTEMISPFQLTQSQKKARGQNLMPENSTEQTMVVFGSDSSSADNNVGHGNNVKTIIPPVSPPAMMSDQNLSSSTEQQGTFCHDLKHDESASIGIGQDRSPRGNVASGSYSTAVAIELESLPVEGRTLSSSSLLGQDRSPTGNVASGSNSAAVAIELESLPVEGRTQSSSSLLEIGHFREEKMHDSQNCPPNFQQASKTLPNIGTPSRERNGLKFFPGNSNNYVPLATDKILSGKEVPLGRNEAFLHTSASSYCHKKFITEPSHIKSPSAKEMAVAQRQSSINQELTQSPSRKDQSKLSNDENVQTIAEKSILYPNSILSGHGHSDSHKDFHVSKNENFPQDTENHSVRKRRIEESISEDASHADKLRRTKRSTNIYENLDSDLESVLECASESDNIRKMTKSNTTMKDRDDILLKFSTDAQQLLSPLIDKLNMRSIGVLQDILVHLQKIKIYGILSSHIRSQKIFDQLSEVRNSRLAETKMLLYKLAYEKARKQLLSVTREKMLKRAQQLSSAVQKSQMLNSNMKFLFLSRDKGSTIGENLKNPIRDNLGSKDEVSMEKVATKRQELEALDRKITNLTKFFHSYFKLKGEPSSSETIVLLNDHLKKKTSFGFIQKDLQLFEVDDFGSSNGIRNIVLNYKGLIFRRFVINDGPIASIFVSNELNELNIAKNFPNVDACVAFAFVLNVRTTKKLNGYKSFIQETQIACSLLNNLLDVIGEVQLAQIEIRNLVQTSFQSSSVEQLDLKLSFIDPNNGKKMIATLDMTCLKCGVYPSDIFPYRLQAFAAGTYAPLPESASSKIKTAADGLTVGYSRIMMLCRCISQVLQSSST